MGFCANLNNPCPVGPVFMPPTGLSFRLMDTAPSGKTNIPKNRFPLVTVNGRRTVEVSLSAFWLITRSIVPLQAFLIITFKLSLTAFCWAHPGMPQICHTLTIRGWGIRNSLISLPLVPVSSDKV